MTRAELLGRIQEVAHFGTMDRAEAVLTTVLDALRAGPLRDDARADVEGSVEPGNILEKEEMLFGEEVCEAS